MDCTSVLDLEWRCAPVDYRTDTDIRCGQVRNQLCRETAGNARPGSL